MNEEDRLAYNKKEAERKRLARLKKKEQKKLDAQFKYDYEEDIKKVAKAGKFHHVKHIIDEHTTERLDKLVNRFYR